jgi:hypothetical protein
MRPGPVSRLSTEPTIAASIRTSIVELRTHPATLQISWPKYSELHGAALTRYHLHPRIAFGSMGLPATLSLVIKEVDGDVTAWSLD